MVNKIKQKLIVILTIFSGYACSAASPSDPGAALLASFSGYMREALRESEEFLEMGCQLEGVRKTGEDLTEKVEELKKNIQDLVEKVQRLSEMGNKRLTALEQANAKPNEASLKTNDDLEQRVNELAAENQELSRALKSITEELKEIRESQRPEISVAIEGTRAEQATLAKEVQGLREEVRVLTIKRGEMDDLREEIKGLRDVLELLLGNISNMTTLEEVDRRINAGLENLQMAINLVDQDLKKIASMYGRTLSQEERNTLTRMALRVEELNRQVRRVGGRSPLNPTPETPTPFRGQPRRL